MAKQTVCVLFGGKSSEHEISCISASNVIKHLDKDKYELITVGITKEGNWQLYHGSYEDIASGAWKDAHNKACILSPDPKHKGLLVFNKNGETSVTHIDVIFPVLHGRNGEDGTVQGLFELCGIPYVGCGVLASSVCMDKILTKTILKAQGIPVTDGFDISNYIESDLESIHQTIEDTVGYPVVIKPSNAGSSVGITLVKSKTELNSALALASEHDRRILIETAVDAREVECAVLGGYQEAQASLLGELVNDNEMYDYETKYLTNTTSTIVPAKLDEQTTAYIRDLAVKAFHAVDGFGLSRVDFFVSKSTGKVVLNEINTLPGFTNISMYPMLWGETGIPYARLLTKLIELALGR